MDIPAFFDLVTRHFHILLERFGFRVVCEESAQNFLENGLVRLSDGRHTLEFILEGRESNVWIYAGRAGEQGVDAAWIFSYLTRTIETRRSAARWLYYNPRTSLNLSGDANIDWQLARLEDVLLPMWPAIFVFLDRDGACAPDFLEYIDQAGRSAAQHTDDGYRCPLEQLTGRVPLGFAPLAQKAFHFLNAYGYKIVHTDPVYVRFETGPSGGNPAVYVNAFHRLQSFQVGVHTGWASGDPAEELNFTLEELAAWTEGTVQAFAARSGPELNTALQQAARTFRKLAAPLLAGDGRFLDALLIRRIDGARWVSRAWEERHRRGEAWTGDLY